MKSLMRSTMVPYWGGNYQLLDDAPPVPPHGVSSGGDVRLEPGAFTPRMPENKVKCVLVGDGAVGKTSLIVSYTTNGYPTSYVPTAFDNYSVVVAVDGKPTQLELCDTAGQDEFDLLRPLCYPNADVFLLCFSVVVPSSFHNAEFVWMPEIRRHAPCTPLLLVGTQADLRDDVQVLIGLAERGERPVSVPEARRFAAQEGAAVYVECSALTQKNLKEVFDLAILAGLGRNSRPLSRRRKKCHKKGCATDKVRSLSKTWWKKYSCFG